MALRVFSPSFGKNSLHILHKSSRRKGCSPSYISTLSVEWEFWETVWRSTLFEKALGTVNSGLGKEGHRKRLPGDKILKPIPTLALQGMLFMVVSDIWALRSSGQ